MTNLCPPLSLLLATQPMRQKRKRTLPIIPFSKLLIALLCWTIVLCVLATLCAVAAAAAAEQDLYKLLGVSRKATAQEIKRAYRRKALDTHPDKNKGIPAEEAAEAFRQVVHAFEILSDDQSRRHYDRTGRAPQQGASPGGGGGGGGGGRGNSGGGNWQYTFTWNTYWKPIRLKDKFEVQRAQSRVLHVVSLEQLKTIMLDDDDLLERNLLMCFVKPGKVQEVAEDEIVFPYPFAAMSSQGIWWEDLLQTVQIRFHRASELSKFFGIPDAAHLDKPIFLFGRRGQPLSDQFDRLETSDRQTFETWMWKQIEIQIQFVNEHTHPVEVYWIHGTRAELKMTLPPGHFESHTSMLSHEWWVRDARVDTRPDSPGRYRLTDNSCLGSWKIVNDTNPQRIVIAAKKCFDLSGHCNFWQYHGECKKNPNFMAEACRKTCKLCTEAEDAADGSGDEL